MEVKSMTRYYEKVQNDEILILAIDDNNNYSIASDKDPEPVGYTNHQWGDDVADWIELTPEKASAVLGYEV